MKTGLSLGMAAALVCAATAGSLGAARAADLVRDADGPFISGGAYYIARDKGYFRKLGIEIQDHQYIDGALAVPGFISGDLDIGGMTAAAGLFNSVAKGAPLVIILDRGQNKPGFGYTATSVTQELYNQGVHSPADFAKLKGKRVGVGALGSINQYNVAVALEKVGVDPATDVHWIVNVPQPDLMKMLGQRQVDVTDLAYQFGVFAQRNKWGPLSPRGIRSPPMRRSPRLPCVVASCSCIATWWCAIPWRICKESGISRLPKGTPPRILTSSRSSRTTPRSTSQSW